MGGQDYNRDQKGRFAEKPKWGVKGVAQRPRVANNPKSLSPGTVAEKRRASLKGNASVGTLTTLASDPDETTRANVARHGKTPPTTLAALSHDDSLKVQQQVAMNPHTPPQTLRRLAEEEVGFEPYLAVNPQCPADMLTGWATADEMTCSYETRLQIVNNPNLPTGVRNEMRNDPHHAVREAAASWKPLGDTGTRAKAGKPTKVPARTATVAGTVYGVETMVRGGNQEPLTFLVGPKGASYLLRETPQSGVFQLVSTKSYQPLRKQGNEVRVTCLGGVVEEVPRRSTPFGTFFGVREGQ